MKSGLRPGSMAFLYSFIWFDVSLIEIGPGVFLGGRWQGEIEEVANDPGRISYVPWTLAVVVVVFSGKTPRFEVFFRSFLCGSYCPFIQLCCIVKSRLNLSLGVCRGNYGRFLLLLFSTKQNSYTVQLYCIAISFEFIFIVCTLDKTALAVVMSFQGKLVLKFSLGAFVFLAFMLLYVHGGFCVVVTALLYNCIAL